MQLLPSACCDNDDDSDAAASQVTKLSEELSQVKARLASKRKEVSCHGSIILTMGMLQS